MMVAHPEKSGKSSQLEPTGTAHPPQCSCCHWDQHPEIAVALREAILQQGVPDPHYPGGRRTSGPADAYIGYYHRLLTYGEALKLFHSVWFSLDPHGSLKRVGGFDGMCRSRRARVHRRTTVLWPALRQQILKDKICARCGLAPSLHVHHRQPCSRGGEPLDPCNLEPLCAACHHARYRRPPVGAKKQAISRIRIFSLVRKESSDYKASSLAPTRYLKRPEVLIKQDQAVMGVLVKFLQGNRRRAEMVSAALRYQGFCRFACPSGQSLATVAGVSTKTWERTLAWLRDQGWVRTWRLVTKTGRDSVNLMDFTVLWHLLLKLLSRKLSEIRWLRGQWMARVEGFWCSFETVLQLGRPPGRPPPEACFSMVGRSKNFLSGKPAATIERLGGRE